MERQAKANDDNDELLKSVRRKLESWQARLEAEDAKIKARLEEAAKLKAAQEHTLRRTRRRNTQSRRARTLNAHRQAP